MLFKQQEISQIPLSDIFVSIRHLHFVKYSRFKSFEYIFRGNVHDDVFDPNVPAI